MKKENTNFIKLIAIVFMVIDHIGLFFFENNIIFRVLGRISFPLFLYSSFIGYYKTRSFKNYVIRLLLLAIISEPIHYFLFNQTLNVCFSLIVALLILYCLDKKKYFLLLINYSIILLFFPYISYSYLIIFLPVIFFYTKDNDILFMVSYSIFYIVYVILGLPIIYLFSIFALIPIYININIKINKYIYYFFYPFHMVIIYIFKVLL